MKTLFRLIAIVLILLIVWNSKPDSTPAPTPANALNATNMPGYLFWQAPWSPPAKHTTTTSSPEGLDTQHLKQSAWFSVISKNIEQDLLHFRIRSGDSLLQSENREQLVTGTYAWDYMQLASMHRPAATMEGVKALTPGNDWTLALRLENIAFNDIAYYYPLKNAVVHQHDSSLVYDHAGSFAVQYLNTAEGVRQNFIINRAPATVSNTHTIRVHMAVRSGLRAYTVPGGKELHFARPGTTGGLTTELSYTGLKVWDARGRNLDATMEATGNGKEITIQVAASEAAYPITIDPLSTTVATTLNGAATSDNFGYTIAPAGDVNGDGFSDVIVGTGTAGKAYAFYGSTTGLSTTAAWTTSVAASGYGSAVGSAGDVNGDGYSDVVVGAPGATKAFVYYGSATGLSTTAAWTVTQATTSFGISVALAGDVNGDGFSDIIIGASGGTKAFGYYGSASGLPGSASWTVSGVAGFGISVASAGDVNGDGYSDVIVGAGASSKAYSYYGSSTGLVTSPSWNSPAGGANYGGSVASAGDVNGDGYSDVVIGSSGAAKTYVYYGSSTGIVTAGPTIITVSGSFGNSVACAGDVNADGYADIIVGNSTGNTAYVYYGAAAGLTTTAAWTTAGSGSYGFCVAPAGDVNGDGFSDVIVGATGISTNTGAAYVYTGSPAGTLTAITTTLPGIAGQKGFNVASAGDINADGYSDVIVGVSGVPGPLGGSAYTGAAYLYKGSATGLSTTASWSVIGAANSDYGSVASAGDVNGDGYADVIVGASSASSSTGAAFVYLGSAAGLGASASWTAVGPAANSNFGYTVACAGDVNADGYSDIIVGTYAVGGNAGAAYVYYGSSAGPAATASWTGTGAVNSYYGGCVASAGDVNGDGFSDIIVGAPGVSSAAGAAYVYYGSATGLAVTAAWSKTGATAGGILGISVACAGDINGDGFSDVIIGASGVPPGGAAAGTAYVYDGSAGGLAAVASWTVVGGAGTLYGWKVASAGDVNGDGYSDIIVGAFGTSSNAGAAYMYYGTSTGLSTTASWTATGAASSYFGGSVASAGDVDGDGYSDVVVGPYGGAAGTASVFEYAGNANASDNAGTVQLWNSVLTTPLSASNKFAPTFGASIRPVSFIGATKAKLVWDVQKNGVAFLHTGTITTSVGTSGSQASYTSITGGMSAAIIKTAIAKPAGGLQSKIRMRVRYSPATAITGQVFGPWKYSANYMAGNQAQMALPITLLLFNGTLTGQGRALSWATAQEEGGSSFELQRSADGQSFTALTSIAAGGTGAGAQYNFTDQQALPGVSTVYYRLAMINIDGSRSYSSVVAIKLNGDNAPHLQLVSTVVTGNALVRYNAATAGQLQLRVVNLSGQVMLRENLSASKGINSYAISTQGLARGWYILQGGDTSTWFVKQ